MVVATHSYADRKPPRYRMTFSNKCTTGPAFPLHPASSARKVMSTLRTCVRATLYSCVRFIMSSRSLHGKGKINEGYTRSGIG
jgi:hypothetical protein